MWIIIIIFLVLLFIGSNAKRRQRSIGTNKPMLNAITCEVITASEFRKCRDNKEPISFEVEIKSPLYKKDRLVISKLNDGDLLVVSWWEDENESRRLWGINILTLDRVCVGRPPYSLKTELANRFDYIKRVRIEKIEYETPRIWVLN